MITLEELKELTSENNTGCWIWSRSKTSAGYGQITINKQYWTTHRLAYFLVNGHIPEGLHIRHLCHQRDCCNPSHLESGTAKENYNDSREVHDLASKKKRGIWIIEGIRYSTIREASRLTGISQGTIVKYTVDGVFQTEQYRASCKMAGWPSKV